MSHVEFNGKVVEVNRDKFIVQLEDSTSEEATKVLAQISGKLRQNKIRICLGDRVRVKVSVYDTSNGIIISRQ